MTISFCSDCGEKINKNVPHSCSGQAASRARSLSQSSPYPVLSEKSGLTAFLLCLFLGSLGVHRFYVGKMATGILMLFTCGGLGIWYLYDLITIVCNHFTDKNDHPLEITRNPSTGKIVAMVTGSIFAAFLLFFASLFLVIWMFVGGLAVVAQEQLAALRTGDYEKAYSYTSSDFKKEISLSDFTQFINANPALKNNISASFPEREVNNNVGIIRGTLTFSDGKTIPIEIQFIKEEGNWKIIYLYLKYKENDSKTSD
jgi:TM2 domain-containing membrane protein YozV